MVFSTLALEDCGEIPYARDMKKVCADEIDHGAPRHGKEHTGGPDEESAPGKPAAQKPHCGKHHCG